MTKNNFKKSNIRIHIASAMAIGILVLGMLPMSPLISKAYGVNCCYATHNLNQFSTPDMYGVRAVYKIIDTTISSGQIHAPTWATLGSGIYREVGWEDSSTGVIQTYYAIDGVKQLADWAIPTVIMSQTKSWLVLETWNVYEVLFVTPVYTGTGPSQKTTIIQTGYEPSKSTITLPKLHFNGQSVYETGAWRLWTSGLGLKSSTIVPDPDIYYVKECGGTAEQWYHTMHGMLPAPGTCT